MVGTVGALIRFALPGSQVVLREEVVDAMGRQLGGTLEETGIKPRGKGGGAPPGSQVTLCEEVVDTVGEQLRGTLEAKCRIILAMISNMSGFLLADDVLGTKMIVC